MPGAKYVCSLFFGYVWAKCRRALDKKRKCRANAASLIVLINERSQDLTFSVSWRLVGCTLRKRKARDSSGITMGNFTAHHSTFSVACAPPHSRLSTPLAT